MTEVFFDEIVDVVEHAVDKAPEGGVYVYSESVAEANGEKVVKKVEIATSSSTVNVSAEAMAESRESESEKTDFFGSIIESIHSFLTNLFK